MQRRALLPPHVRRRRCHSFLPIYDTIARRLISRFNTPTAHRTPSTTHLAAAPMATCRRAADRVLHAAATPGPGHITLIALLFKAQACMRQQAVDAIRLARHAIYKEADLL